MNTSSSRVEVRWNPFQSRVLTDMQKNWLAAHLRSRLEGEGWLRVVASDTRSQRQNRLLAEQRLTSLVARALVIPKKRVPTRPTRASQEKRLLEKKRRGQRKRDRRDEE